MATVGDVTVGLDDSGFRAAVGSMLDQFAQATDAMRTKAEETGNELVGSLGAAIGSIGAIGGLAGQAFTQDFGASLAGLKDAASGALQSFRDSGTVGTALDGISGKAAETATLLGDTLGPALSQLGLEAAGAAVQTGASFAAMVASAAPALTQLGLMIGSAVAAMGRMVVQGAVTAAGTIAQWASMAATAVLHAATVVAQWVLMAAQALAQAARMALAWIIAMGPIPLIIAAVVALVALIILNWQTIVDWTTAAFTAIWSFLQMVWNGIVTAIQAALTFVLSIVTAVWNGIVTLTTTVFTAIWGFLVGIWNTIVGAIQVAINAVLGAIGWLAQLPGRVAAWFGEVFSAAVGKLGELLSWLGGLPGRILGALGDLGGLLLDVGGDILEGLWNGLKNAANWIKDKIIGLISAIIPGPIKDILGIGSPSKVAAELGRWVPVGLAKGIEDASAVVANASADLAGLVTGGLDDLAPVTGPPVAALAAPSTEAAGAGRAAVHIDNFYASPDQSPARIATELDWMSRGGG
jgi:hypothetical protein